MSAKEKNNIRLDPTKLHQFTLIKMDASFFRTTKLVCSSIRYLDNRLDIILQFELFGKKLNEVEKKDLFIQNLIRIGSFKE